MIVSGESSRLHLLLAEGKTISLNFVAIHFSPSE